MGLIALFCWLGVIGMWRMREPMQALHYLSLPACGASVCLVIAVFLKTGSSQASWKTLLWRVTPLSLMPLPEPFAYVSLVIGNRGRVTP
jgi:multisubunit Na+/H+ antiporter MnhG subunit